MMTISEKIIGLYLIDNVCKVMTCNQNQFSEMDQHSPDWNCLFAWYTSHKEWINPVQQ
jgi:hypothetical protein